MKGILKLLRAQLRLHWVRMLLTTLAMSISVMLVVWTIGAYDSLLNQSDHIANECLGNFDLLVMDKGRQASPLESVLVHKIQADPQVQLCFAVNSINVSVLDSNHREGVFAFPRLVGLVEGLKPFDLAEGRYPDPDAEEVVLSQSIAERRRLKLGDTIQVEGPSGAFQLKLVGLVRQSMMLFDSPGAFSPASLVDQIAGRKQPPNTLYIKLKKAADVDDFITRYKLVPDNPKKLQVISRETIAEQLGQQRAISALRMQGYFAASVAMLAALFIVFTTLSMGVSERSRQLAILRAIGLTRRQVVGLILGESFVLAFFSWILGLLLGIGLLKGMVALRADVFASGMVITPQCLWVTFAIAMLGAGLAGALPAFLATRLRPLDAIAPRPARPMSFMRILPISTIGLVLLCIAPLIVFVFDISTDTRFTLFAYVGCPSGILGFALLTPAVILLSERLFVRPLGWLFRIRPKFLQNQLSGNLWRSVGTCISLSTGLSLFIAIQMWGSSILVLFLPGDGLPDAMVSVFPSGLDDKQVAQLKKIDSIADDSCLPMAIEQVKLSKKTLDSPGFETVKSKNLLMMGFDASRAIDGKTPVVAMTFLEGNSATAAKKLGKGRYCIVPDHFTTQTGLGLGDRFEVELPRDEEAESKRVLLEYEIAGVVSIPGWQWVTKLAGMKAREGRSLAAVFIDEVQARKDFHLDRTNHFWMNIKKGVTPETLEAAITPIAEQTAGTKFTLPFLGEITAFRPFVKVVDTRELERMIRSRAASVLWVISVFPLLTLLVTSLAVINTVVMSIRVRRWEFGVLRSVGMTRSQQLRLVLSESLLIGLSACLLSFLFGMGAAWCAMGICRYVFFFGGLTPPLVFPWLKLFLGFGVTLAICFAAAFVPAILTACKEPLSLLKAGRQAV